MPQLERLSACDPATTHNKIVELVRRDGGVVLKNLIDTEHVSRIRKELRPAFETDVPDQSGFFPSTTRRATGLLGISNGCVDLATNKLWIDTANDILTSECRPWYGEKRAHYVSKPILAGTFGFQIGPGSRQQDLHRDDRSVVHNHLSYEFSTRTDRVAVTITSPKASIPVCLVCWSL